MTWHPHDIETEQALLGAVLMQNAVFGVVSEIVNTDHFYEPIHKVIWQTCVDLITLGKLATPQTIKPFIPEDIDLGGVKLREYIARLAAASVSITQAPHFAKIVRELYDKRIIGETALEMAPRPEGSAAELAAFVVERMDEVIAANVSHGWRAVTMAQSVIGAIDAAASAYQNEGKMVGLSYGLSEIDQKTLGAQRGNLIVLAGRPGMGKTALAVCIARNLGIAGHKVLFYSAEMVDVELTQRMITDQMYDEGRMFYSLLRSGRFREKEFERIRDAGEYLATLPIRIEQQPQLTLAQLGTRARQMKSRGGLDALFVDHIGLMKASGRYAGNKVNETGEITGGLKALAKELDIPIFALAQIVRGVDAREDKRPALSDLRNSGDIEQDADTVILLYRESYYLARKEPPAGSAEFLIWEKEMEDCAYRLDAEIAKQRSGPTASVKLLCDIGCNAIRNWRGDFV